MSHIIQTEPDSQQERTIGPLDRVLSSAGRIRILQHLSHNGESNLTEIAKKTCQSYVSTARHLEELDHAGIVREKNYGRVRMFKLKTEVDHVRKLYDLIIEWDKAYLLSSSS